MRNQATPPTHSLSQFLKLAAVRYPVSSLTSSTFHKHQNKVQTRCLQQGSLFLHCSMTCSSCYFHLRPCQNGLDHISANIIFLIILSSLKRQKLSLHLSSFLSESSPEFPAVYISSKHFKNSPASISYPVPKPLTYRYLLQQHSTTQ